MKTSKGVLFALATTVVLAAISAGAGTAVAAARPSSTVDISFDGFCDGFALNIPSAGLGTKSTVDGSYIGCGTGAIFGTARPNKNGKYGVTKGTEYIAYSDNVDFPTHTVINKNHTWVHYRVSNGLISVLNSGTWSLGAPAQRPGLRSSFSSASARPAAKVRPASTLNITFDGFCDGMQIVTPSAGLGTQQTVDGFSTGSCITTSSIMGSKTKILGKTAYVITTPAYDGSLSDQFVIFKNHTWEVFQSDGTNELLLNTGTWSTAVVADAARSGRAAGR